ncbi:D-inositol-3-phosphate glycosyltransferase [Frigoribacterium sp. PhB107]|uniref:glycosyltransferase n=1 Tax=Frigoribacterium sp. PhB107 TaxID=2485172 RepID=UPI000FBCEEE0|nr:glycosyltransferase [Frigoribacterium sp. PhB107]ROP77486.1 D-inositol-3-phosphate glycosyltransferase [Frigoribacterium sp. PhB107]
MTSPLRIALVSLHTSPGAEPGSGDVGGMNVVVRNQAEALGAAGHEVEILTRRSSPDEPEAVELAPGVVLRFLTAGPVEAVPKGRHEEFVDEFRERLAELGPWDAIHSHHWFSGVAALPIARQRGIPHVQSFHSIAAADSTPLSHGERAESPGRLAGEAMLARESDAVVAISHAEAETVTSRLGGDPARVAIVLPGVDAELFRPLAAGETASHPTVVVAGRLEPLKGPDLAIEAVAAVPAELRPELVIAGGASTEFAGYERDLAALADQSGLDVRFLGPQTRPGLASLLREARLVLVPSHSETYGLIALEAAASGVPVVAASSGGLRESVVDGVTGVVLDSRDPAVWGETVTRLLGDGELWGRLARASRERALEHPWSLSAAELSDVYCRLVGSDPCRALAAAGGRR